MKSMIMLGLFLTSAVSADVVYMQEDSEGKSIILQQDAPTTLTVISDSTQKVWALYPDISPDGQEVIFVEGPGANDLHLTYKNLKKNTLQRFHTDRKGMLLHPKFSKNLKYIYYSSPGPIGKNTIYYFDRDQLMREQGKNLTDYKLNSTTAIDETEESYFPRPSSDGNFVVYQRNTNGKKEIILFDRLENKKIVIAEGMSPALSFDEQWIAFTSKKDGNWNIYLQNRSTGELIQATNDPADEMSPSFMPDNTLVFSSNKSGHYRLFKLLNKEWISILGDEAQLKDKDFYSPQYSGEKKFSQDLKSPFIGNPRSSFGTIAHEGKIYMAGGHQGTEHTYPPESFTDTFVVYDQTSNSWVELSPRPARAHGYQLAAHGNYIYAFGGFAYSDQHRPKWKSLDQIDRYDIKTNKWETIGRLKNPRSSNAAVTVDQKVYLLGGWDSTPKFQNDLDGNFLDEIEVFDLVTEKASLAPFKLPQPLRRAFTSIEHDGKIILIGGLGRGSSHFELINNVTSLDPKDGSVTELSKLPFATFAPAAEVLGGELFVFGGMFKLSDMNYEYVSHIYGMNLSTLKWRHTGRFLKETKGFSQVFKLDNETLGILGGHHYFQGYDSPVTTFESFSKR